VIQCMTPYDWYIFFLCLIVFIALTVLFSVLIAYIVKLAVRLIRSGVEDETLLAERAAEEAKKSKVLDKVASAFFCVLMTVLLGFSLFINIWGNVHFENIPTLQAVKSDSMAKKNPENIYLYENRLNDQIDMFDLVLTYRLPDEFDLQLYDIVIYEAEGTQIMHRIVHIEEPNVDHPTERRFTLQGDAIEWPDKFSVRYAQMKGIYRGERVPFAGSFILFMQSPAGWMCILLVVFAMIVTPVVEKRFKREKEDRLRIILGEQDINM